MGRDENPARDVRGALLAALTDGLGARKIVTEPTITQLLSRDVSGVAGALPMAVIAPEDTADVVQAVRITGEFGLPLAIRGGGMSYTQGYKPDSEDVVLLDLRDLKDIEINRTDGYVVVGAGCTWQSLAEALEPTGMRSVLRGPISGGVSTVGGAVSQAMPGSLDGLLGLEVVTADGTRLLTGGAVLGEQAAGFYRSYGPDVTGLFVGDCGVHGIKTRVWLRIVPKPAGVAFASFAFETMKDLVIAMIEVAQQGASIHALGMDPLKNQTATRVNTREGVATLWDVVRGAPTLMQGLTSAAAILRAGRDVVIDVQWSLHLTAEGYGQGSADKQIADARRICRRRGEEIQASIPRALHARPFSIRGFVGLDGERWLPVHGIFPYSKAELVVNQVQEFFAQHQKVLADQGIAHSFIISAVSSSHWLIEPMFYWPDALTPLHMAHLSPRNRARFGAAKDNAAAREAVFALRQALAERFAELGAAHVQLGRFYAYAARIDAGAAQLTTAIKRILDHQGRLNPGNLDDLGGDSHRVNPSPR